MSWKLVRDHSEEWCRANGVSGQWRTSPGPAAALRRKLFEEAGEYAEQHDPAELYDLLDVLQALIRLEDPSGDHGRLHHAKITAMGGFTRFAEWTPVPEQSADWSLSECDVCGLPDAHGGTGDGIGSCDCPRCDGGEAAHSSVLCICPPDEDELYATLQAEHLAAADIPRDWPRGAA